MPQFTKTIETPKGKLKFIFSRIYTVSGIRFHISVKEDRDTYFFNMEEKAGVWRIINAPKVPDWIMDLHTELGDAITKSNPYSYL
jgi:hypothetical protein